MSWRRVCNNQRLCAFTHAAGVACTLPIDWVFCTLITVQPVHTGHCSTCAGTPTTDQLNVLAGVVPDKVKQAGSALSISSIITRLPLIYLLAIDLLLCSTRSLHLVLPCFSTHHRPFRVLLVPYLRMVQPKSLGLHPASPTKCCGCFLRQ